MPLHLLNHLRRPSRSFHLANRRRKARAPNPNPVSIFRVVTRLRLRLCLPL